MGMFDSIRCDYPLPDPSHQRLGFQTKSLFCMLLHYTITVDGRLLEDAHRDGRHVPVREWPFNGDLIMGGGDPGRDWVDYFIRFTHGRVEQVRRLEEPLSGEEALRRDEELDERLLWPDVGGVGPALEGRRLTESEFAAQAPASLSSERAASSGARSGAQGLGGGGWPGRRRHRCPLMAGTARGRGASHPLGSFHGGRGPDAWPATRDLAILLAIW